MQEARADALVTAQRLDVAMTRTALWRIAGCVSAAVVLLTLAIGAGVGALRADHRAAPVPDALVRGNTPGSWLGFNRSQSLAERFDSSGVQVTSAGMRVRLRLQGIGSPAVQRPVAPVEPQASGDGVVYSHGSVVEWYANATAGLEQGFTVYKRLPGTGSTLTLALSLGGDALAVRARDGRGLLLTRGGGRALQLSGLSTRDSAGHFVPSRIDVKHGRVLIEIDTRRASYPLYIDPFVQQANLTGSGEVGAGSFGAATALSSDGSTAIVGAPADSSGVGAAFVYTRSGSTWTQQQELLATGESGAGEFGRSVAISPDGSSVIVGGPADSSKTGAAWVFTRSGTTWTQQGELTGSGESGPGEFGRSIALSADGTTAVVGGPADNGKIGAVWPFTRSGAGWTPQGTKLTANPEAGSGEMGFAVALSSDGNTALVGGPGDNGGNGAAWTFTRAGSTWSQSGSKLFVASQLGPAAFGTALALSGDANTALIGAPKEGSFPPVQPNGSGACWAFTKSGSSWSSQTKITEGGGLGEEALCSSVALSTDGSEGLIGAPLFGLSFGAGTADGQAYVLSHSGTTWNLRQTFGAPSKPSRFGSALALSGTGEIALSGGPSTSPGGAAWAYGELRPIVEELSPPEGPEGGGNEVVIKGQNFGGTTEVLFVTGPQGASVPFILVNEETLRVPQVPPGKGLAGIVVVTNQSASEPATYTYVGRPVVSSVSPTGGSQAGGTKVTIAGNYLGGSTAVSFGGKAASNVHVVSSSSVEATSPPGTGAVDVTVTTPSGTSLTNQNDRFTYAPFPPPTVVTLAASAGRHEATLNGTVNPNGSSVSSCEFEYGTGTGYGHTVACSPSPGSGTSPVAVSAVISGLTAETQYHFRLVATGGGGPAAGQDEQFTTARRGEVLPEFGRCVHLKRATGKFASGVCTVKSEEENTGGYEWEPGPGPEPTFSYKNGRANLTTASGSQIRCTHNLYAGEYTGAETATVRVTFTGCEPLNSFGVKCRSAGASAGEIKSNLLLGTLGFTQAGSAVGLALTPSSQSPGVVAAFTCGETPIVVRGAVIARYKPLDRMAAVLAAAFRVKSGTQFPGALDQGPLLTLEAVIGTSPGEVEPMTLSAADRATNREPIEIKALP